MNQETKQARMVPQNLGWVDRLVRFIIGTALLAAGMTYVGVAGLSPTSAQPASADEGFVIGWAAYAIVISIYPYLTAILGMDPVYRLFGFRTCGGSETNPCGTLPYELKAAKDGHAPELKDPVEHSLESADRTTQAKPHR